MKDKFIKLLGGYTEGEYRDTHDYDLGYAKGNVHGIEEVQDILKELKKQTWKN
jgi:predicted nucleotidyltransferase